MISITLQNVRSAEPVLHEGSAWVTLRFDGDHRVVFHLDNFTQAVRMAAIFTDEIAAQAEPHAGAGAHEEDAELDRDLAERARNPAFFARGDGLLAARRRYRDLFGPQTSATSTSPDRGEK